MPAREGSATPRTFFDLASSVAERVIGHHLQLGNHRGPIWLCSRQSCRCRRRELNRRLRRQRGERDGRLRSDFCRLTVHDAREMGISVTAPLTGSIKEIRIREKDVVKEANAGRAG